MYLGQMIPSLLRPVYLTLYQYCVLYTLTLVHRIQIIGHSYIAHMEWPRIVPREICIYVLYVCYNSENKQQQQQQQQLCNI